MLSFMDQKAIKTVQGNEIPSCFPFDDLLPTVTQI